jgi:beta-glucanase (GH16 family)
MSHHEAEKASTQLQPKQRHGIRRSVAALSLALIALAVVVSCKPIPTGSRTGAETSATVIATASVVPTIPVAALEPTATPTKPGYKLVFNDEFAGSRVSSTRWERTLPWGNTNGSEQQYYTPSAVTQSGGLLTITARRENMGGKPYTSGVISSHQRFTFTYGYSEIRAQVPAGDGLWSAFWLVSPIAGSNDEADIMEVLGSDPTKGYAVLHYGTVGNKGKSIAAYREPDFSAGFHTFALDWQPDHMIWYVDDVERYRVTQNIPSTPMYIVANLAVGGASSWAGPPDKYTEFPAQYTIDYVRVFQPN